MKQSSSAEIDDRQTGSLGAGAFFASLPGLYLIVDPNLRILDATNACLKATMSERSETVGRELIDAKLRGSVERAIRTHQTDATAVQQDDREPPLSWKAVSTPVVDPDGIVSHVVLELKDVTELEGLRESNLQLRTVSEAQTSFLCRLSHELRSPLTAVIGYSEILQSDAPLGAEDLQAVEAISNAGEHLLALTDDLLDLARIESGRMQMSLEPVKLQTVLHSALELIAPLAARRGVTLSPPDQSSTLHVSADVRRLTQVVVNLLTNAIKYNRPGGRVSIEVTQSPLTGQVRLSVTDTGIGISERDLTKLFQPFERLGAETSDVEGTGLGLSLTRSLVEEMGGTIDVHSEVGVGTRFSVELRSAPKWAGSDSEQALIEPGELRDRRGAGDVPALAEFGS